MPCNASGGEPRLHIRIRPLEKDCECRPVVRQTLDERTMVVVQVKKAYDPALRTELSLTFVYDVSVLDSTCPHLRSVGPSSFTSRCTALRSRQSSSTEYTAAVTRGRCGRTRAV